MASFNEIPDHLKADVHDTWTLEQGLFRGGVAVFIAAVIIGIALYWITYRVPGLTMSWLLSGATTFFMAWVMFAIMHHFSGTIHPIGNTIVVIAMIAVVIAKNAACLANAIDASPAATGSWSALEFGMFMSADFPAWMALTFAAIVCRHGEVSFEHILEFATGRHWWPLG